MANRNTMVAEMAAVSKAYWARCTAKAVAADTVVASIINGRLSCSRYTVSVAKAQPATVPTMRCRLRETVAAASGRKIITAAIAAQ